MPWTPDTICDCKRIISPDEMFFATESDIAAQEICDIHKGIEDVYSTILKESQMVEETKEKLRLADPSLSIDTENGLNVPDMEKIKVSFDEDRNLIVELPTLSQKEKDNLNAKNFTTDEVSII